MCVKLHLQYAAYTDEKHRDVLASNESRCECICIYCIVLTALNVFQPNKHFITAANSTVAALLHQ